MHEHRLWRGFATSGALGLSTAANEQVREAGARERAAGDRCST